MQEVCLTGNAVYVKLYHLFSMYSVQEYKRTTSRFISQLLLFLLVMLISKSLMYVHLPLKIHIQRNVLSFFLMNKVYN